jgi:glycosyltransferase involved in cell wall biosynthesis
VFAMSSLFEGLPCAVVEAMACGIPVVATAVNSVPEIVVSGKTGLLARPGDPASLSEALSFLLDHPAEATRMAEGARVHIGNRFTPDALGRDLMDVYDAVLGAAASGSQPKAS